MSKNNSLTSLIEDHEEDEAKKFIVEHLGFDPIKAFHKRIAVKIYLRPEEISTFETDEGKTVSLYLPPVISAMDKFRNCVALVIFVSPACYQGDEFKESGPYCKVGDWIVIPRNVGTQINYRGVPVQLIPEDALYCVIEDPTHIEKLRRH